MPRATLKEKGQLTLPAAIRSEISARAGDVFEVDIVNGDIVLKPQILVARRDGKAVTRKKGPDIGKWIGSGKGQFASAEEAADFIRKERAAWD